MSFFFFFFLPKLSVFYYMVTSVFWDLIDQVLWTNNFLTSFCQYLIFDWCVEIWPWICSILSFILRASFWSAYSSSWIAPISWSKPRCSFWTAGSASYRNDKRKASISCLWSVTSFSGLVSLCYSQSLLSTVLSTDVTKYTLVIRLTRSLNSGTPLVKICHRLHS